MTNKDVAKKLLRYVVGYFVKTGFPAIALNFLRRPISIPYIAVLFVSFLITLKEKSHSKEVKTNKKNFN